MKLSLPEARVEAMWQALTILLRLGQIVTPGHPLVGVRPAQAVQPGHLSGDGVGGWAAARRWWRHAAPWRGKTETPRSDGEVTMQRGEVAIT